MNYEQSTEKIWLWQGKAPGSDIDDGFRPTLELYTVETDKPRGAVLICPGGGYCNRAPHEGKPVAEKFNEAGFHAFVVQYRVAHRHPAPLLDASRALRIIRHRSDDWNVNPDQIAICGFSAGGHLAGSLGVHFDNKSLESENPIGGSLSSYLIFLATINDLTLNNGIANIHRFVNLIPLEYQQTCVLAYLHRSNLIRNSQKLSGVDGCHIHSLPKRYV